MYIQHSAPAAQLFNLHKISNLQIQTRNENVQLVQLFMDCQRARR